MTHKNNVVKTREYVIVSPEHSSDNLLAFWGEKTDDNEKRSFCGYTYDIEKCERYTKEDIQKDYGYISFVNDESFYSLMQYKDFAIKIDDLLAFKGMISVEKVVRIV